MICVNGKEIDFDITCPDDLRRYYAAGEKMARAAESLPPPPADIAKPEDFQAYISFIEEECKLLTDFIDEAFGNGVCNTLLGEKTSLEKLLDTCDAIGEAVETQGQNIGVKIRKYTPNRNTRRAKK